MQHKIINAQTIIDDPRIEFLKFYTCRKWKIKLPDSHTAYTFLSVSRNMLKYDSENKYKNKPFYA